MLNLRAWKPINYPGDNDPPIGPRARIDWLVLALMLTDLARFAIHVAPRLHTRSTSAGGFVLLMLFLFLCWLGPFLGVVIRRGRGAALLCYGVAKIASVLAMLGSWWANRSFEETLPLPIGLLAWHIFGITLILVALWFDASRRRRTRMAALS